MVEVLLNRRSELPIGFYPEDNPVRKSRRPDERVTMP